MPGGTLFYQPHYSSWPHHGTQWGEMPSSTFHHNFCLCSYKTYEVWNRSMGGEGWGGVWNGLSDKTLLSFFSHSTLKCLVQFHLWRAYWPRARIEAIALIHTHQAQLSPDGHYLVPCLTLLAKLFIERVQWRPWVCFMGGGILTHAVKIPLSMFLSLDSHKIPFFCCCCFFGTQARVSMFVHVWGCYIFLPMNECVCVHMCALARLLLLCWYIYKGTLLFG